MSVSIRLLDKNHKREKFECGESRIDNWFLVNSWKEQKQGRSRVYCLADNETNFVIGFYNLTFIAWDYDNANNVVGTKSESKGSPLPSVYLPRIGVRTECARQGYGGDLIRDALQKSVEISRIASIRTLSLHAINEEKAQWYTKFGFQRIPPNEDFGMALPLSVVPVS